MNRPRPVIVVVALALGGLAVTIPSLPGQNPNNPKGIDVYNGTGTINWTSVKNSGVSFAFLKATEGLTFQDSFYSTNRTNAKAQGIVIGAYHFARPSTSPSPAASGKAQADYFINYAKPAKGEIQCVCDFEVTGSLNATDLAAWLTGFVGEVQAVTHTPAIIYCSPGFWSSSMPSNWTNPNCGLWVANWGVSSPSIPAPWASTGYAFWQYSSTGSVPGVTGNCDLDTFNGSSSLLLKFTYPRDPLNRR
jgi:GH25 family lysozyme M1 (1,4-beta-N-acetylmuramidase)